MSLSAEDIVDIQQVLARYTKAVDVDPPETIRELFVEDSSFVVDSMNINISGIDNIVGLFTGGRADSTTSKFHFTSNVIVDGDGQNATASSYFCVMQGGDDVRQVGLGRYCDELVKTDKGWKLKARSVVI